MYNILEVIILSITNTENILRVLSAFNPWWITGNMRPAFKKTYKRFAYFEALNHLEHKDIRRAVVLTGTRRVGKTTIQYQMIEHLLEKDVNPKRVLFVSLDHPLLKLCNLNDILRCYKENVYGDEDTYYFFDEVQYAADWDLWIKTIYDTMPLSKVVATGSASPVLVKRSGESGAGRWTVIQVPTLSFYEYCDILDIAERPILQANDRPSNLVHYEKREWADLFTRLSPIQKHFHRYLQVGGFPELSLSSDDYMAQNVMREDVVDKVLKRDIPSLFNIRNSTGLERIFLYLCFSSSNIIAENAIAKELESISLQTVRDYIQYLESANLIYRSYPVDMDGKKVLKGKAKIYIADAAIRNAVLMQDDILMNPEEMGIIVETAVYKHIAAFYYQNTTRVGYYRDTKTNKEIDIVVDYPTGKILIEVKYREQASITEKDAIYQFCDEAASAIVVTKRENDYGVQETKGAKKIIRIPAYAFLYLLGNAEKNGYKGDRS